MIAKLCVAKQEKVSVQLYIQVQQKAPPTNLKLAISCLTSSDVRWLANATATANNAIHDPILY
jgi:hypothetical protein